MPTGFPTGSRRVFLGGLAAASPLLVQSAAFAAEATPNGGTERMLLSTTQYGAQDTALAGAAKAAATDKRWVSIDGPADVTANLTISAPVEIRGGPIRVKDGVTLTFGDAVVAPPRRTFAREDGWRGTIVFGDSTVVTPSWWEKDGDDDTEAVQTALTYPRVLFTRGYKVTSVTASGTYQTIDMGDFLLQGIATAATDAVLTLRNWRDGRLYRAGIISDGEQDKPQHALNYACALRAISDDASTDKTQYGFIYGLRINRMRTGIVWGNHAGEAAQARQPQSEFHIYDYRPRGVLQPFVGNAENGYLQFHAPIFQAQRFESAAAWWVDADGWTIRNESGAVRVIGGSIQRAISAGYNLYGRDIVIEGVDVERNCPDHITGDVAYHACRNGYYGVAGSTPFQVAPQSTGRLLLNDVLIRRPDARTQKAATANFDASNLVDAMQAPDYEVVFRDVEVRQWRVDANHASAYLVRGGHAVFGRLIIDNTGSNQRSYRLTDGPNRFAGADPTGRSMATTDDLSAKGGWAGGKGKGGFHKVTADLPPGVTEAIRLHADTPLEIETAAAFAVDSGRDHVLDFWLKYTGKAGSVRALLRWLDATGGEIARVPVLDQEQQRLASSGFGSWLRFRAIAPAPSGAMTARLAFALTAGAELLVTDLRIV